MTDDALSRLRAWSKEACSATLEPEDVKELVALFDNQAQRLLEPLLEYEGGQMQSMSEMVGCSAANDRLIRHAAKFGVTFSPEVLKGVGRRGS